MDQCPPIFYRTNLPAGRRKGGSARQMWGQLWEATPVGDRHGLSMRDTAVAHHRPMRDTFPASQGPQKCCTSTAHARHRRRAPASRSPRQGDATGIASFGSSLEEHGNILYSHFLNILYIKWPNYVRTKSATPSGPQHPAVCATAASGCAGRAGPRCRNLPMRDGACRRFGHSSGSTSSVSLLPMRASTW